MANAYLLPLFHAIFGKENMKSLDDRRCMQYAVYLCMTKGADIEKYIFRYIGSHGPISMQLRQEINEICDDPSYKQPNIRLPGNLLKIANEIRDYIKISEKLPYSEKEWLECLCSIIQIKKFVMPSLDATENEIFDVLKKRQPHLYDYKSNKMAYFIVKNL